MVSGSGQQQQPQMPPAAGRMFDRWKRNRAMTSAAAKLWQLRDEDDEDQMRERLEALTPRAPGQAQGLGPYTGPSMPMMGAVGGAPAVIGGQGPGGPWFSPLQGGQRRAPWWMRLLQNRLQGLGIHGGSAADQPRLLGLR